MGLSGLFRRTLWAILVLLLLFGGIFWDYSGLQGLARVFQGYSGAMGAILGLLGLCGALAELLRTYFGGRGRAGIALTL